jgi:hypothetical protein
MPLEGCNLRLLEAPKSTVCHLDACVNAGGLSPWRHFLIPTVSNGLRRAESRGFDFDVEERSIAVQRLNSRLSQFSNKRSNQPQEQGMAKDSPTKSRLRAGSIGGGFNTLRSRAGSILKPKKGFYDQTRAMEGERGPDEAT